MIRKWKLVVAFLSLFLLLGATFATALAGNQDPPKPPPDGECKTFYLGAIHGINGEKLGLDKELPVDVYVNGKYAFTFSYKELKTAELPAGVYTIDVRLAGSPADSEPVMSLGPVEIPGCVKVIVKATLMDGVPTLKVIKIRELPKGNK